MINVAMDEQHIRGLIKKYTDEQPLSYWFMTKIKYHPTKEQQKNLNSIYDNVKHLLVNKRESLKIKEALVIIFINFYRLHKMSISYGKEKLNNNLVISSNNNVYVGKNTTIPKILRLLCKNDYIVKEFCGYSYEKNKKTSKYMIGNGMKELISLYVEMKNHSEVSIVDMSSGESNIRLKIKNESGKKVLNNNFRWNNQLRTWNEQLTEINNKLSMCSIDISDIEAFKKIYDDKNYEILVNQYKFEEIHWNKAINEYKLKNNCYCLSDETICDLIIERNNSNIKGKFWDKWIKNTMLNDTRYDLSDEDICVNEIKKEINSKYWKNVIRKHNKQNVDTKLNVMEICLKKVCKDNTKKKSHGTWKNINAFRESIEKRCNRIINMGSLFVSLPNQNTFRLYRTYINDFKQGGRHYHIWVQNIPNECQNLITIDNEPVINIDICSCHMLLIAAQHGISLKKKEDYYDIGVESLEMNASRKNIFEGLISDKKEIRKKIKQILLTLINVRDEEQYIKAGIDNGHTEVDLIMIKEKFIRKYNYLQEYLCSNKGVYLQNEESDFIQQVLYESIVKNDLVIIPMCDGVICKLNQANKVEEVMFQVWKKTYTVELLLERK